MGFIKRLFVVIICCGLFATFIISQGKWESVRGPVSVALGEDAAQEVDKFGQKSEEMVGKAGAAGKRVAERANGEVPPEEAHSLLKELPIISEVRIPDYDREEFGTPWADVDKNKCDTRNDILARDLTNITKDGTCTVLTGQLADPYTGTNIDFKRGTKTSSKVQIDHIVSLSAAWKAGAHAWSDEERLKFANDPMNLMAVDGPTNSGKSDKTPASWMPSNVTYQCTYVAKFLFVVDAYDLSVSAEDKKVLSRTLETC